MSRQEQEVTPGQLAAELDASAKAVRAWLRQTFPRSPAAARQRWELTSSQIAAAREHFSSGPRPSSRGGERQPLGLEPLGIDVFEQRLDAFTSAPMISRDDVLASPCPVPSEPGVYGWWFRQLPPQLNGTRRVVRDGSTLLYVGISPRRPPTNSRPPSSQTLRDRLRYHYRGNAEGSTLRKTLGSLLADELGLELRRVGSGNRMTFVDGERTLSGWMAQKARVSWLVDPAPWLLEARLIAELDVPLNLGGDHHNPFHPRLTAVRSHAVTKARQQPVLPNPGTVSA